MGFDHGILRVLSGEARGPLAATARLALACVEPLYASAAAWRNRRFDRNPQRIHRLPKPVISVGNLTTGGTGKTPVVRYLAELLAARGLAVGILSRGYKATPGSLGDEQRMLLDLLRQTRPAVNIETDPDRFRAGQRLLQRSPQTDVLLLDDGFQHRRLHRDLDIVLLHAGEPFGFGHVLPRGLLRERPEGLKRAGLVILTNTTNIPEGRQRDEQTIAAVRRWNSTCPIVRERHEPVGFRQGDQQLPLTELAGRRAFCFSGLGMPGGFESSIRSMAGSYVGQRRYPDHHDYTAADLEQLQAVSGDADVLVTTEKDWVKLAGLPAASQSGKSIWRLDIAARFDDADAATLASTLLSTLHPA